MFFRPFDIIVKMAYFLQEVTLSNLCIFQFLYLFSQTISFSFCFIFKNFR